MTSWPRLRRIVLVALCGSALGGVSPAAHGAQTDMAQIGAALPTVADFPTAGLRPRTAEPVGVDAARAPFPCADRRARGMRGTKRWGEWLARGGGRSVRVLVFAYSDQSVAGIWRDLRRAIADCPRRTVIREDDGSRGTATVIVRRVSNSTIRIDHLTRSASGSKAWSKDRAIVYQRVGDAIQKVQVSRQILTAADRALVAHVARVSRAKYLRSQAEPPAPQPGSAPVQEEAIGDVDAPLTRAIADLPAGAELNVSIGDSMLSGEGGRWRGNVYWYVNWPQSDALGTQAYWDTPTGEAFRGCHRTKGAPIRIPGTHSLNLACSGAKTTSAWVLGDYKPGIDEGAVDPSTGRRLPGQLTMLAQVARQAKVGTVALSIGGNDLGFGDVAIGCMAAFMRPWPFEQRCRDNATTQRYLSDEALAEAGRKVEAAIVRVHETMRAAGYADGSWRMVVQNYPRLIAEDSRYADTYADRLYAGGCPVHSTDVRWMNERLPMTETIRGAVRRASMTTGQPVRFVDTTNLFAGRELCARGAEHVDRVAPGDVTAKAERVHMVRVFPPFSPVEGLHPNQIGQQAVQACLREAMRAGASGRCEAPLDWAQVDADGLPRVRFVSER